MDLEAKLHEIKKPIMVLGTSSGAGKSLTVTAICRILKNLGEKPIPFKGQNMSNNAWVDGKVERWHIHRHFKLLLAVLIPLQR